MTEKGFYLGSVGLKLIAGVLPHDKNGSLIAEELTAIDRVRRTTGEQDAHFDSARTQELLTHVL